MDVEVDDEHALEAAEERVGRGHRHVPEQAEAHGPVGQGMMAGRTHRAEGAIEGPIEHPVDGVHHRPRRQERRLVRLGPGLGVGVEAIAAALGGCDEGKMAGGVHPQQLGGRRGPWGEDLELRLEAGLPEATAHGFETVGPLGMAVAGVVLAEERVVVQTDLEGTHVCYCLTAGRITARRNAVRPRLPA